MFERGQGGTRALHLLGVHNHALWWGCPMCGMVWESARYHDARQHMAHCLQKDDGACLVLLHAPGTKKSGKGAEPSTSSALAASSTSSSHVEDSPERRHRSRERLSEREEREHRRSRSHHSEEEWRSESRGMSSLSRRG